MDQEVFKAGVRPGSPNTQTEIKTLLCFILSNLKQSITFAALYEALGGESLVNYFELVASLEQLERSGHITRQSAQGGEDLFSASPLGAQAAGELTESLPLSMRDRSLEAVSRAQGRRNRLAELSVLVEPAPGGGYTLRLSIPEQGAELISFSLYAPTKEQCELIRRRFLNAPHFIYKGVLALLTGNQEMLDEAFPPPEDQLF